MKKFLLIYAFIFILPAWSACPISSSESVCTISGSGDSGMLLFQNQNKTGINSGENTIMHSNTNKSSGMGSSFNKVQNKSGIQMQGSLGCQFGNCSKNDNDFLPNQ